MVAKLEQYPQMRFIYAEMSFFSLWWTQIDPTMRQRVKKLVAFFFVGIFMYARYLCVVFGLGFVLYCTCFNKGVVSFCRDAVICIPELQPASFLPHLNF